MSLRERIAQRARAKTSWPLRIDDTTEAQAALEAIEHEARILIGTYEADSPEIAALKVRLEEARVAVDACYEQVELEALTPVDFEALAAEHPANGEVGPDGEPKAWADTFGPALLLECVRGDLERAEWEKLLAEELTEGEKISLINAAIILNMRSPNPGLPKGWRSTPS